MTYSVVDAADATLLLYAAFTTFGFAPALVSPLA
jgi:hypothetical protein